MIAPNGKRPEASEPKKESIAGFLFNPHFGQALKPIGQSTGMFVRLIALLFAMNGLFPKNHPALLDIPGARLGLGEVLATAYRGLSYTREGLPQVFLFFAAVGSMVCGALAILALLLTLGTTPAHAADSAGIFESNVQDTDISIKWLDYLFAGKPFESSSAVSSSTAIQTGLRTALAFFSNACLVLAGIILMYHLLSMVVETAHSGRPMGNANQIWAPIRLVLCLGLLIPIGSGGLNVGQAALIQVAKWGCGLASHTWSIFLDKLNSTDVLVAAPPSSSTDQIVHDVVMMQACKSVVNYETGKMTSLIALSEVSENSSTVTMSSPDSKTKRTGAKVAFGTDDLANLCGYYITPNPPEGSDSTLQAIYTGNQTVFQSLVKDAEAVSDYIACFMPTAPAATCEPLKESKIKEDFQNLVTKYQDQFKNAASSAINNSNLKSKTQALVDQGSADGWAGAGAWFHIIAVLQRDIADATANALPQTKDPDYAALQSTKQRDLRSLWTDFWKNQKENSSGQSAYETSLASLGLFEMTISGKSSASTSSASSTSMASGTTLNNILSQGPQAWVIFHIINRLGYWAGIWPSGQQVAQLTSASPLAELAMYGVKFFSMGLHCFFDPFGAGAAVKIAGHLLRGSLAWIPGVGLNLAESAGSIPDAIAEGITFITEPLRFLAGLFIPIGVFLGFVLPMIPFIMFFFAVLTWLIVVFEAVVSMPLFALAHLTPKGEGLAGPMASKGYFFMLSILLRPVLTVFGLIAGLLLFDVAVTFLNKLFVLACNNSFEDAGFAVPSKIIFSIMYAVLAYICANTCFKAITHFPEHALNWMGQSGPMSKDLHNESQFNSMMGITAGYFGGQAMAGLGNSMKSGAKAVEDKKGEAKKVAEERRNIHADALVAQAGENGNEEGSFAQQTQAIMDDPSMSSGDKRDALAALGAARAAQGGAKTDAAEAIGHKFAARVMQGRSSSGGGSRSSGSKSSDSNQGTEKREPAAPELTTAAPQVSGGSASSETASSSPGLPHRRPPEKDLREGSPNYTTPPKDLRD